MYVWANVIDDTGLAPRKTSFPMKLILMGMLKSLIAVFGAQRAYMWAYRA